MEYGIVYLCVINIITFLLYGLDKQKAKQNRWRIPEKVLLGAAAFGGTIGALIGMRMFHHKTQKWKFKAGVPLILVLQIATAIYFGFVN